MEDDIHGANRELRRQQGLLELSSGFAARRRSTATWQLGGMDAGGSGSRSSAANSATAIFNRVSTSSSSARAVGTTRGPSLPRWIGVSGIGDGISRSDMTLPPTIVPSSSDHAGPVNLSIPTPQQAGYAAGAVIPTMSSLTPASLSLRQLSQQQRRERDRLEKGHGQGDESGTPREIGQRRQRESKRSKDRSPALTNLAEPSRASLAQQQRRMRERLSREGLEPSSAQLNIPTSSRNSQAQQDRRKRERVIQESRNTSTPASGGDPNARSTGQLRRRKTEAANRDQPEEDLICGLGYLSARKPWSEPAIRHDAGRMSLTCSFCGAAFWEGERLHSSSIANPVYTGCCDRGQVQLPTLERPPAPLDSYLESQTPSAKKFRDDIWKYNRALAFTSLGVNQDHTINENGRGRPVFRISGELYHRSGALTPNVGKPPTYAQLYVIDPAAALDARMNCNVGLDRSIMTRLQDTLRINHQYAPVYKQAYEILSGYDDAQDVSIRLRVDGARDNRFDDRVYALPTLGEVAVILPEVNSAHPRDIVLRIRSGPLHRISELHPAYLPLQYPLLFPRGENGWHEGMTLVETEDRRAKRLAAAAKRMDSRLERGLPVNQRNAQERRLTLTRYAAYRIHFRPAEFNILHRSGGLFNRLLVDLFAAVDQERLRYIVLNQAKFRAARFSNLQDAHMGDPDNLDLNAIGQRVFLPSTYTGGPRHMHQCYQDSMAIARFFHHFDLFLTMTTNPEWPEIQRELLPGQEAYDRPDLVAHVFELKKNFLLDLILKKKVFGPVAAYVYTIEFQKRGLPHMHLLICLEQVYKVHTPDMVDACISAELPDPVTEPMLFDTVRRSMIHMCGAQCWDKDGKCTKGYPKEFRETTEMAFNAYPQYRRRDDGRSFEVGREGNKKVIDNRSVVPYPRSLVAVLDCHINLECAFSLGSIRYLFKYIQKGPDRGSLEIDREDEVKTWVEGRYISAPDSAWRLLQYKTHVMKPNVYRLQVHLEGHHTVTYNPGDSLQTILENGAAAVTTLTAFFEANADAGELGALARTLTYQEFPHRFVFNQNDRRWTIRKRRNHHNKENSDSDDDGSVRGSDEEDEDEEEGVEVMSKERTMRRPPALGRMYFLKPTAGEVFYLRTLLTVVKGPTSFEDIRRVPGHPHPFPTYHAACVARGLLEDSGEWRICLAEACEMHTSHQLRNLFATLLLFGEISWPEVLWEEFKTYICDDLEHKLRQLGFREPSQDSCFDYGLFLISLSLEASGAGLDQWPSMPKIRMEWQNLTDNSLIAEHRLQFDIQVQEVEYKTKARQLNQEQQEAFDDITNSILTDAGQTYFLHGPGGTGKTFVYGAICARVRAEGFIVLCVSSSGISAIMLPGGRTSYSLFKIPIEGLHERSVCAIPKDSERAGLMRSAKAIIWDEAGAQHRFAIEAVDRTLRDLRDDPRPFGGLTTVFGGDFLQTLPVIPRGSRGEIVNATLQQSPLWRHIKVLHLKQNMRLDPSNADASDFAQWLLEVGHGLNDEENGEVAIPPDLCVDNLEELIESVYPGLDCATTPPPEYFKDRMLLAPRNTAVSKTNEQILAMLPGDAKEYFSADEVLRETGVDGLDDEDPNDSFPMEVLRDLDFPNFPPGILRLKVGCPIILLRNINASRGLCNGTQLIVTQMRERVIEARILSGDHAGELVLLPRIALLPSSSDALTIRFRRRQFPVRLAFALTVNKAQGQSVKHVGIDLSVPVFSHGQLYVALSRVTARSNLKVLLPNEAKNFSSPNVVFKEVIL